MNTPFNEYKGRLDRSALIDGCREKGRLYHYAKREIFVREGEVGRFFGVVEFGYFKYVTVITEGNEAIVGFAFEGESVCEHFSEIVSTNILLDKKCTILSSTVNLLDKNVYFCSLIRQQNEKYNPQSKG